MRQLIIEKFGGKLNILGEKLPLHLPPLDRTLGRICLLFQHNHVYFCSNYASYINIFPFEVLPNQSLFWSGTQSLVNILSMMNAMVPVASSANIIPAEIINNTKTVNNSRLNWCGSIEGENAT